MILSAHQGGYLPWMPLLDRINQSDIFVLLDGCQFEKGSFTNRQKIGNTWLTIPVNTKGKPRIRETRISSQQWRRKHYQFIWHRWCSTERLNEVEAKLEWMYGEMEFRHLGSFLAHHLVFWCQEYGITTPIHLMPPGFMWNGGTDLVIKLCKHFGADEYLSGPLGKNYLDEELCQSKGLKVIYHPQSRADQDQCRQLPSRMFWGEASVLEHWMSGEESPFSWLPPIQTTRLLGAEEPLLSMSPPEIKSTS